MLICFAPWPVASAANGPPNQESRAGRTEILWDEFGVPHIYGKDLPDVLRGYGYAQMENHAELLLQLVAAARGRSAEYFGPGESNRNVSSDISVRTHQIPQRAARWYLTGGAQQQRLLDAFAKGINEYAATHSASIAAQFRRVLPVTPADALAVTHHSFHYTFMPAESDTFELLEAWQTRGPPGPPNGEGPNPENAIGSNGWAIAPAHSTSGNAVLLGNPHLPWGMNQPLQSAGSLQFFEAHLVSPGLNAHGVAFVGVPFIAIGFNDDLGWTHVANSLKNVDLYELTLVEGGYLYDGQVRPLLRNHEQIRIRQPDGTFQAQRFEVLASIHGPIVAQRDGKALAMRVAGLDASAPVSQYWDMIRAHNLEEFNQAFSRMQMPYFNLLYADRHGDIMYVFGGHQPVRSGGKYADWRGILRGDTSSTMWTRVLSWNELPKVINPAGGFAQNCNNSPWTSTFPQELFPEDYPAYLAPQEMSLRAQHSARFLLSKPSLTFEELLNGKMSTRMELAARVLPDLLAAANASGDATAIAAAAVLQAWPGTSDASSRGAALFESWYEHYVANRPFKFRVDWSAQNPLNTPQGLGDPARAVQSLIAAAKTLQQQFGAVDVPWGDVHRTVLVTWDDALTKPVLLSNTPASGSSSQFGGLRVLESSQLPGRPQQAVYHGDSYVQLVEFAADGPRAETLLSYGNASRPGSAHITDQLTLFNEKRLRPVPRTRQEVEAQTVARESLRSDPTEKSSDVPPAEALPGVKSPFGR